MCLHPSHPLRHTDTRDTAFQGCGIVSVAHGVRVGALRRYCEGNCSCRQGCILVRCLEQNQELAECAKGGFPVSGVSFVSVL